MKDFRVKNVKKKFIIATTHKDITKIKFFSDKHKDKITGLITQTPLFTTKTIAENFLKHTNPKYKWEIIPISEITILTNIS